MLPYENFSSNTDSVAERSGGGDRAGPNKIIKLYITHANTTATPKLYRVATLKPVIHSKR